MEIQVIMTQATVVGKVDQEYSSSLLKESNGITYSSLFNKKKKG